MKRCLVENQCARVLLLISLFAGMSTVGAQENPYQFFTEDELQAIYSTDITRHWREEGHSSEFTGKDGLSIAYRVFEHRERDTAIVISSGRTESFIKYKELIYDLSRLGFSVFIHDHRGQGLSDRLLSDPEIGHVESFDDYVTDLHTFVQTVVKPTGHRHYILLAHSMGGAIGSLYLQQFTDDFDAAVLSSPMHEPGTGWLPGGLACGLLDVKELLGRAEEYAPGKGPFDDDAVFTENSCCTHSEIRYKNMLEEITKTNLGQAKLGGPSVKWGIEACDAAEKARENAGKITVPVLLLSAGDDEVVTRKGQETFCSTLNETTEGGCQLEVIEGALHELFIESDQYRIPALNKIISFIEMQTGKI